MGYNIQIIMEKAKDNNYTCKVIKNNKDVYLYSKYYPKKNIIKKEINDTNYIVLGLGLGYEVQEILDKTNKKVYVIDYDESFYDVIKDKKEFNNVTKNKRVTFLFGDKYKDFVFENNCSIYFLNNIISLKKYFFYKVLNFFKIKDDFIIKRELSDNSEYNKKSIEKKETLLKKKKIIFFERDYLAYILKECADTFSKMGFEVQFLYVQNFDTFDGNKLNSLLEILLKEKPDIVFSINYLNYTSIVCAILDIYYISWIVDHPWWDIYKEEIKNEKEFIFNFEEKVVKDLRKKGIRKNIFYLPCAVNTTRINKKVRKDNFITDISFVGNLNSIVETYYNNVYNKAINNIIEIQNKYMNKYVIKDLVDKNFSYFFNENTDVKDKLKYISLEEKLSLDISFVQSHVSRLNIIKAFEKSFSNFKVYGNDEWSKYINCWAGHRLEYFNEMPDIFNKSKININLLNTQYETAIPLRLFDILGSAGFALTNYREKLLEYFDNGIDIAVFKSVEEGVELAAYYLKHDEIRIKMAENAYEKVKKFHTYEDRVNQIVKIVFG